MRNAGIGIRLALDRLALGLGSPQVRPTLFPISIFRMTFSFRRRNGKQCADVPAGTPGRLRRQLARQPTIHGRGLSNPLECPKGELGFQIQIAVAPDEMARTDR
jgi:hypothetical protein